MIDRIGRVPCVGARIAGIVFSAPYFRLKMKPPALKVLGAATAAAAGAVLLRPFRGAAVTCPAGAAQCGGGCCEAGATCNFGLGCCCPKGTAPCGNTCCNKGIACLSVANSLCGCPPQYP